MVELDSNFSEILLRREEVERKVGLSKSSIYAKIAEGDFPPPISIGERQVRWLKSDIIKWMNGKVEKSKEA